MRTLYQHPVKFVCRDCKRGFSTMLGYAEHRELEKKKAKEDREIADNMKSYWGNLSNLSER